MRSHNPDSYYDMSTDDLWTEASEMVLMGITLPLDMMVAMDAKGLPTDPNFIVEIHETNGFQLYQNA